MADDNERKPIGWVWISSGRGSSQWLSRENVVAVKDDDDYHSAHRWVSVHYCGGAVVDVVVPRELLPKDQTPATWLLYKLTDGWMTVLP